METKDDKDYFVRLWNNNYRMNNDGCCTPIYAIIIISILVLFCSCATKKIEYVDRDVVKYETKIQHDTLINNVHDSVYHTIFQKGDTIYDTKYVEKTKYRNRIVVKTDTCYKDSVVTEYKETTKEIVKIPKIYSISLWFSIICIIFAMIKLMRWLRIR
jgi:hypothetical protein